LINVEAQLGAEHPLREVKRMSKEVDSVKNLSHN